MTKLYEVKTTSDWVDLNTLTGHTISGIVELFNAGREGGVDILWTESVTKPEDTAFCRILKRQKGAIFTVGTQPIWVKSEASKAKLMISTSNTMAEMVQQALTNTQATQATAIASAIQDTIIENPMATSEGQIVVSNSESFLARKLREGRLDRSVSATTSYNGTLVAGTVRAATPNTILYPTCFNISSSAIANGYFEIVTGIASADTVRRYFSLTAGQYASLDLPEGYYVLPTGNIKVYITATSATCSVEVEGVEVAYNG